MSINWGPNITRDDLGGSPVYTSLAISYMVLRILISAIISIICMIQLWYEIKYQSRQSLINPRLFTWIGLILYPIFRILYTAVYFFTVSEAIGTACDYFSFWSLFFQLFSWTWVAAYWARLILALFSVIVTYDRKVWVMAWSIIGVAFLFVIVYHVIAQVEPSVGPYFFNAGFLAILAVFGSLCVGCGFFLYKQIYQYKGELLTDKVKSIIKRIRNLAIVMAITIVITLLRDLLYYNILLIPLNSTVKHASNVITMTMEFVLAGCMMISIAEEPLNYLKFKCVNPSLVPIHQHQQQTNFNSATSSLSQKTTSFSIGSSRSNNNNNNNVHNGSPSKSKSHIYLKHKNSISNNINRGSIYINNNINTNCESNSISTNSSDIIDINSNNNISSNNNNSDTIDAIISRDYNGDLNV